VRLGGRLPCPDPASGDVLGRSPSPCPATERAREGPGAPLLSLTWPWGRPPHRPSPPFGEGEDGGRAAAWLSARDRLLRDRSFGRYPPPRSAVGPVLGAAWSERNASASRLLRGVPVASKRSLRPQNSLMTQPLGLLSGTAAAVSSGLESVAGAVTLLLQYSTLGPARLLLGLLSAEAVARCALMTPLVVAD